MLSPDSVSTMVQLLGGAPCGGLLLVSDFDGVSTNDWPHCCIHFGFQDTFCGFLFANLITIKESVKHSELYCMKRKFLPLNNDVRAPL